MTATELARDLFRSTRTQLLTLPDATRVYPAHGAGSACGRKLSTATVSTIGEQRATNYALADMTEDAFVEVVTEGLPDAPAYFAFDAQRNRDQRELLDETTAPPRLSLADVLDRVAAGAVVLDTRDAADYAHGHLRDSLEVGLGGRFAEYAGDVLDPDQPIILVCDAGTEIEAKVRLARIGFDNVVGVLDDHVNAFLDRPDLVDRSSRLAATELAALLEAGETIQLVDVRTADEITDGAVTGAVRLPLARITSAYDVLRPNVPTVVFCSGGYRSAIAASTLRALGFTDVSDVLGGFEAMRGANLPITVPNRNPQ